MVSLNQVEVIRSGKHLFKNFSFESRRGEHWLVSGKNGSGKTTLLELIAGVIHPAHGTVAYDFIQAGSWDERFDQRRKKIHYVPTHAIQSFLQGHEMFYQQRYYSIGDERTPLVKDIIIEDLAALDQFSFPKSFDISRLLGLPVTRLSNGQLKKVIILKHLVRQLPEILLLDYPFEGLDSGSRNEFTAFLDHLVEAYGIHLMIADHHHQLPACINRNIELENFKVVHRRSFEGMEEVASPVTPAVAEQPRSEDAVPVVEMKNVTIRYGESVIIKGLNWSVHQGERWALLGRNGSGKTTLFSMIFADHPLAYSEKVFLFGKRRGTGESIWDIKKRINYLGPELISFLNHKTIPVSAREYIHSRHTDDAAQMAGLIEFFDAEKFLPKPVKFLSSGELQLMLLLDYFLSNKELLLLDEPFQFLDPVVRDKVTEYLQYYLRSDITLIMITHYERDVAEWTQHTFRL